MDDYGDAADCSVRAQANLAIHPSCELERVHHRLRSLEVVLESLHSLCACVLVIDGLGDELVDREGLGPAGWVARRARRKPFGRVAGSSCYQEVPRAWSRPGLGVRGGLAVRRCTPPLWRGVLFQRLPGSLTPEPFASLTRAG